MKTSTLRKEISSRADGKPKRRSRRRGSRQQCTFCDYKPYDGILVEPIESLIVTRKGDASRPPTWYKIRKYSKKKWSQLQSVDERSQKSQRAKRLDALHRHYGIDPSHPGSSKDLALTLAVRHEQFRGEHGRVTFWQLYNKYGIDPASPDADKELVLQLAEKHIKGFEIVQRIPRGQNRQTVWSNDQLLALFSLTAKIGLALRIREGRSPSARGIAKVIVSPTRPNGITSDVWEEAKELRRQCYGNRKLSYDTVRKDVGSILKARESYLDGKANHLQSQLIFECSEENDYLRLWLMDGDELVEELADILMGRGARDLPGSLLANEGSCADAD